MNPPAPSPPPAQLPVSLAANPKLSSWLTFSAQGQVTDLARQGRNRARHRDGAGADRRRRTRCRYFAPADGPRVDRHQSQRGRDIRQSLGAAVRARAAACLRRGPPDIPRTGVGTPGGGNRYAWYRRRHHFGTRQCQDQLLGACRRRSTRSRRNARREGQTGGAAARWPEIRSSGSIFPTRCLHDRVSSTIARCRECCTAACCGQRIRAQSSPN